MGTYRSVLIQVWIPGSLLMSANTGWIRGYLPMSANTGVDPRVLTDEC